MNEFFNTRAPILVDHNPADKVGVIESATISADRRWHLAVRFSKSAWMQEIFSMGSGRAGENYSSSAGEK